MFPMNQGLLGGQPQQQTPGILGGAYDAVAANRQALMGLGMGLLSGQGNRDALARGMQGFMAGGQADQRTALLQQAQEERKQKMAQQEQARKAAENYVRAQGAAINPELANYLISNPEAVGQLVQNRLTPKEPKITDDQREYQMAREQGYQGSFMDYQTEMKKAGRTQVNVNSGERTYDQVVGKAAGEQYLNVLKEGSAARGAMANLDRMATLAQSPGFWSGAGGEGALRARQLWAQTFGNPDAASNMEEFQSLAAKATLDAIGGSLGAQISNTDREFVERTAPNLRTTPAGNLQLIEVQKRLQRRRQEAAEIARMVTQQNGGRFDMDQFEQAIDAHAKANPLFADMPAPQAPAADEGWTDMGNGVRIREKR